MIEQDQYCFSLLELAQRWQCAENNILNLAAKKKLCLSVILDGYQTDDGEQLPISGWWQLLLPSEIAGFFPDKERAYFTHFRDPSSAQFWISDE